jgi:hypothetical protein
MHSVYVEIKKITHTVLKHYEKSSSVCVATQYFEILKSQRKINEAIKNCSKYV